MVNHKYLMAAKQLVNKNQRRLDPKINPIEKEIEELFFWILHLLEDSVQNSWPPKPFHSVTVNEYPYVEKNKVALKNETVSVYISKYVTTKQEFYEVMKNVAEIFEKMEDKVEYGARFGALCFTSEGSAELTVNMTAKNI